MLDERGELLLKQKLSTTPKAINEVFGGIPRSRIALETAPGPAGSLSASGRLHARRSSYVARSDRIVAKPSGVWETGGMKKPELTDMAWLGPKEEMDRASHRFGKCSECHEIICVEKAVTDGPSTQGKTSEMLYEAFRAHVKLKHSEDFNLAAIPATERHQA